MTIGGKIRGIRDSILIRLGHKPYKKVQHYRVDLDDLSGITRLTYYSSENRYPRIEMPLEIVTMVGAMPYTLDCNPLMLALEEGEGAYAAFLERYQPTTLAQRYAIDADGMLGADLPPYWMPWMYPIQKAKPRGEWGLGPEHGLSTYGPVTRQKIDLEMRRLAGIRAAIEAKGFRPEVYGDISGYFLRAGDEYRFVVRGGKHRAAVVALSGVSHIPVRMKNGWPRIIDRAASAEWPAVAAGQMDERFALKVFDTYFDRKPLSEY